VPRSSASVTVIPACSALSRRTVMRRPIRQSRTRRLCRRPAGRFRTPRGSPAARVPTRRAVAQSMTMAAASCWAWRTRRRCRASARRWARRCWRHRRDPFSPGSGARRAAAFGAAADPHGAGRKLSWGTAEAGRDRGDPTGLVSQRRLERHRKLADRPEVLQIIGGACRRHRGRGLPVARPGPDHPQHRARLRLAGNQPGRHRARRPPILLDATIVPLEQLAHQRAFAVGPADPGPLGRDARAGPQRPVDAHPHGAELA
jgi:hypothetical protein